jgi:hypothetical protein
MEGFCLATRDSQPPQQSKIAFRNLTVVLHKAVVVIYLRQLVSVTEIASILSLLTKA